MSARADSRTTSHGDACCNGRTAWLAAALGFVAVGLMAGCAPRERWMPVVEETSFTSLENQTGEALAALAEARASLPEDPAGAGAALERAELALLRLRDYYLPLTTARQRAHDAYRLFRSGESEQAQGELAAIEALLLQASAADHGLARELEPVLATVVAARSELAAGAPTAADRLEALGREINLRQLKGELALEGSELESR